MIIPTLEHLPVIDALLKSSGLPTDDLYAQDLALFRIQVTSDGLQGVGGLERCGDVALIRSVATNDAMRGRGIASDIISELERLAASKEVSRLYLLTESAEHYFETKGYSQIERANVPIPVQNSRQFSSLCPATATVMVKQLFA